MKLAEDDPARALRRAGRGGARARARGAAQARARAAPGGAARARAGAGAGVALPGLRRADRRRRLRGRAAAAGRARRVLRGRRGARQRRALRQASRIDVRIAPDGDEARWSRCATTASAAPTPPAAPGCSGLADRVDVLGGRLEVDSPRGGGTLVRATIPLLPHDRPPLLHRLDEANALLVDDPFALLVGFALDQQVTVQKAFEGPLVLRERLGTLDAGAGGDGAARGRSSASARPSIASPARWRGGSTTWRRTSPSSTTATRRGCGPTRHVAGGAEGAT